MTVPTLRTVLAVNHVGVSVRDLQQARRFWVDGLGALEHGEFGWPRGTAPADESLATEGTAAEVVLLRTDAAFMELFAFASPTPAERPATAPGVRALTWAVPDVPEAAARALAHGGRPVEGAEDVVRCPDGTPVHLVAVGARATGLVGVEVRVADPARFPFASVPGPVTLQVLQGALDASGVPAPPAAAVDLGVNHVCLDVDGIGTVRDTAAEVRWHHGVTESSGGAAAVCYGTTHDGVLVELLESRTPSAFLARARLTHP